MKTWIALGFGVGVSLALAGEKLVPTAAAQSIYAYPMAGQTPEQQQRDQIECHGWSVQQSGYDPNRPPSQPRTAYMPPPPQQSSGILGLGETSMLGDAAKGAGLGAAFGAIAGNAGKGAAIGVVTTTLFGGIRRSNRRNQEEAWRRQQYEQQQYQQQRYQQQVQAQMQGFNRAFAACMSARKYQVQ